MELRQLEYLVACAQTGSFSRAASLLYTSQSNVSKVIAALEKELGLKLFFRKQHGICLTPKGEQVYAHARAVQGYAGKIQELARSGDARELRISFQPSSWFARAFADFYAESALPTDLFYIHSASVGEILGRLMQEQDQTGYACIGEEGLPRLLETLKGSHVSLGVLARTSLLLYRDEKAGEPGEELLLVQGEEDPYFSLPRLGDFGGRVAVTTNSDYIMQELLSRGALSNLSPAYFGRGEHLDRWAHSPFGPEREVVFLCFFRDDRDLPPLAGEFLSFIRRRIGAFSEEGSSKESGPKSAGDFPTDGQTELPSSR